MPRSAWYAMRKYNDWGKHVKLMKGKTGRIITTCGASKLYILANHLLLTGTLKYPILRYIGFSKISCTVFPSIRKSTKEVAKEKIAISCEKMGRKDARR